MQHEIVLSADRTLNYKELNTIKTRAKNNGYTEKTVGKSYIYNGGTKDNETYCTYFGRVNYKTANKLRTCGSTPILANKTNLQKILNSKI